MRKVKFVVRKSVYDEIMGNLNYKPKIYVIFNHKEDEIQKGFNPAVHPRDEKGRFTEKGVMELSEKDRELLLDYLEKETYEDFEGIHISIGKINAVREGKYKDEVETCKKLKMLGFDVYLLRESYSNNKKADIFYKLCNDRDFMEIKNTGEHKLITRFNETKKQAPSCFISIKDEITYNKYKKLKDEIKKDNRNGYVIIEYKGKCKVLKQKKLPPTIEAQSSAISDPSREF